MTENKKTFHWRGWTTFVVTISFIVDTLSGIILYIAPPGRVEKWIQWKIWGLTKDQWAAVHTIFGYVLLIIVAIHLYYNWRIFISFLWSKAKNVLNLKRELALSVVACLLIFLGSIWSIPPFSTVMEIGDYFKGGVGEEPGENAGVTRGVQDAPGFCRQHQRAGGANNGDPQSPRLHL
jgi:hypothetical protein